MSLTEKCALNEFCFLSLVATIDFVGFHHTRSVQDDNLFNQCAPSYSLDFQGRVKSGQTSLAADDK